VGHGPSGAFGILTRGFWLNRDPNLSRRGKSIFEDVLCSPVPEAAPGVIDAHGVNPVPPFTGEEIRAYTADSGCKACHQLVDPPANAFERFDAAGRYKGGQLLDTSGYFTNGVALGETTFKFQNVQDFMRQLQSSPNVQACVVNKMARYAHRLSEKGEFESSSFACVLSANPRLSAASLAEAMGSVLSLVAEPTRIQ